MRDAEKQGVSRYELHVLDSVGGHKIVLVPRPRFLVLENDSAATSSRTRTSASTRTIGLKPGY